MSAELLVNVCSPTLAGLKVANLFSCKYEQKSEIIKYILYYNDLLNGKGVYFRVLRIGNGTALILVYRKRRLEENLRNLEVQEFLKEYGYKEFTIKSCIDLLELHLRTSDFPHEIGVFLGYPLADVKAFIKHKGKDHKYIGPWKVYTNVEEAKSIIHKFEKCTRIYREKFQQGTELTRLAVSI